jgi:ADP-ribosylglycohydrolase
MACSSIIGSILGTAVGDALGLPYEGLSRRRGARLLGEPKRHRFVFGRGMVSDDTEHTCMVAQALIASGCQAKLFGRELARRLRLWLLGVPAGIGAATLKATVKLWLGFSPERCGVFSAGNGPAMRSAVLGAAIDDLDQLREMVRISTRITHNDPKAEFGAAAVALAAHLARRQPQVGPAEYLEGVRSFLADRGAEELLGLVERVVRSVEAGHSLRSFAEAAAWGKGISGYIYRSVPAALHVWLAHQRDYRSAVMEIISCGGDTDTTAAIVGGIVGSGVGRDGIPADWLAHLFEWPRTVAWMERLGACLEQTVASGQPAKPPALPALGLLGRNAVFFLVVLAHIGRRCLPPY